MDQAIKKVFRRPVELAAVIKWIFRTIGGLFSFHDAEIITALAELTGDTFLAELALPIVELGSGDYPSS